MRFADTPVRCAPPAGREGWDPLNNRVEWTAAVPKNHWATNLLLIAILALFAVLGAQEIAGAIG